MTTLQDVELGVLGPLHVRQAGGPITIPGAKPRALLTMLGLQAGSVVPAGTLLDLLWGADPPRTAAKALQTHISALRRTLGDGLVLTEGTGWKLAATEVDASSYRAAARRGRDAAAAGDMTQAVARFDEALALWRGAPELPDTRRGAAERTRWVEGHAALVEDRADTLLATGRAAEIIGELETAVAEAPLRERRWGQLMLALYRAGRQGEAIGAYRRARRLLADELGVEPGPELRRLEAAIIAQDSALEVPAAQSDSAVMRAVTFLLTDIEGSTAAWEADAVAMATALARHDELVQQVVTSRGGRLIKTRGEGDATFSVFERPSAAAAAALELQDAIVREPWALADPMRIRVALHTGEAELRDGDYFGRAVNRAARLRSLATGGQILCSGATAELVIDSLPDDVALTDLGMRQLRNLARPEHVFELRLENVDDRPAPEPTEAPVARPALPAVLAGPGPFVGRASELERLFSAWQTALAGSANAVLIAGEPGVGKTRLAGEWSRQAYDQGAIVVYGRCDEDLGAPYQPFAEALRSLVPSVGATRLRGLRGVEALLPLVPALTDVLPDLAPPTRADPDTERYALFDAVVALLGVTAASSPVVLILDDLHWAAKPTLLLLRHVLRFGEHTRVQVIGTYRSTDLDRSHPLAAMLADLHRDGTANRLQLGGLDEDDVTAYVAEAGYDDEELARALASVTAGNPFFLIEALRHVDESGGHWDPSTLPQGVREAVSRRLSRLPAETNKALSAAAVVGSRFAVDLVERVLDQDLIDAFDEASQAGIVIEEPGGRYRFNHAIVRQSLLAELASVRRMRLHQRIAATLETQPGADDELLSELAYHYFECAWAGNAGKAVEYCRRAADQAMARLAYEGAADLYDRALHALEEIDDELPDRAEQVAELLVARCEALLAAGDVTSAAGAVSQLQAATVDSARLAAWATCFDGQLSMLTHPERLDEIEVALAAAAEELAGLDDAAGQAKAHTVRAACLARLGRIGDCEAALDNALTAARRSHEHRRVNAVLAGAPLAALWGPNPVPRAGGRCLDVVRLLRITTDSPAVEAMSTRCQAVLEAFRGRGAAARRMIDSARRTVTELGSRHALLEVEQFAGIVELIVDDPATAELHLRKAYNGFRRMALDADIAETAALLGRACLALDRDVEADELCRESEYLAGHALKPSIAWRTLRAELLSRGGDYDGARRVAEAAVSLAERTDLLVDHGDACLVLAAVLRTAGDGAEARAAGQRALDLFERKGAAALSDRARSVLGDSTAPQVPHSEPDVVPTNACVEAGGRLIDAVNREDWEAVQLLLAPFVSVESRRKIVGFPRIDVPSSQWPDDMKRYLATGMVRYRHTALAVRDQRLALMRLEMGTQDSSSGAPQDEMLQVVALDTHGRIAMQVKFDVEDVDAALAELEALHARSTKPKSVESLQNNASRLYSRVQERFAARDLSALAKFIAADFASDDRRRVVNAGSRRGSAAIIEDALANAGLGATEAAATVVATRGERLVLRRARYSDSAQRPGSFHVDVLNVIEINADGLLSGLVTFEPEDVDAALEELDRRYLDGEAAVHAHTWSLIAAAFAAINRQELPELTPDWVNIDHRRGASFATGEMTAYIRDLWDDAPNLNIYTETVHRLSNLGAVITQAAHGTSQRGFQAEWREIGILTFNGDLLSRCELFDETDLETAIATFEHLSGRTRQISNAACQVYERCTAFFAARDWAALADLLADNVSKVDRRRVVNAGSRHGRDLVIADHRALAEVGGDITATVVATRGELLALSRVRFSGRDRPGAFLSEMLTIVQIDGDHRIAAGVVFDVDDYDAAFDELDARYLAGEAAPYARTWSVMTQSFTALSKRELPSFTADSVDIDHRRATAFAPGELRKYLRAGWEVNQEVRPYVEAVHRINDLGAVVTHAAQLTSRSGFEADWRTVDVVMVEGNSISHCELFDEDDLDDALAKFNQLSRIQLENKASRAFDRVNSYFASRDWAAIAEMLAEDVIDDDRRRTANAGLRSGRDTVIASVRTAAGLGAQRISSTAIATRGDHLALCRVRYSGGEQIPEAFFSEALSVVEVDDNGRVTAHAGFACDDFQSALTELDDRYLAGEATAHADTWSVITEGFADLNRQEFPSITTKFVIVDHRQGARFGPGEMVPYIRAAWDLEREVKVYVEIVHRLSDKGAVLTAVANATSQEGFDAEWRTVELLTVEGQQTSRVELFDEGDVADALARFEELQRPAGPVENQACQVAARFLACFAARDFDSLPAIFDDTCCYEDRRRLEGSGVRRGSDAQLTDLWASADLFTTDATPHIIATRGSRLVLERISFWARNQGPDAFLTEVLLVIEINTQGRIVAIVSFDIDDIEAAFAELDARYVAGESEPYANTWAVISGAYAAMNRHELFATTPGWVNVDHRRPALIEDGCLNASLLSLWKLVPDLHFQIEAVHRLSDLGAVCAHVAKGISQEGMDAVWRGIEVMTVNHGLVSRCEIFDVADVEAAIAKFDELSRPARTLANAASRVAQRYLANVATGDVDAMAEIMADNLTTDDRRRVVGAGIRHGKGAQLADLTAISGLSAMDMTSTVVATRGDHVALLRASYSGRTTKAQAWLSEVLGVFETDADGQLIAATSFDVDDIDAAFEQLDALYLTGEAAPYAQAWSVVASAYTALNRRRLPPTTSDWVNIDHRRTVTLEDGDLPAYLRTTWEESPESGIRIESVHRLTRNGAVVTRVVHGTSTEGFDAEWRGIDLVTVEGELIDRCELFDEEDLAAAIVKLDELSRTAPALTNAAARIIERFMACFTARNWTGMADLLADDVILNDRRRVVNAGVRRGRDLGIADAQAAVEVGAVSMTSSVIATRGERLALARVRTVNRGLAPGEFGAEMLGIAELDAESRIAAQLLFDLDDLDTAFAELDSRYLAGEATPYANTWSAVVRECAAFNRHEITAAQWLTVDHRPLVGIEGSDWRGNILSIWDLAPDLQIRVEAVHRLCSLGAVITYGASGTSPEGLAVEWRVIMLLIVEGDCIDRCEIFDELDLDAALDRFDELQPCAPRLENTASVVLEQLQTHFIARDWASLAAALADDICTDDRRRVINGGVRHGRDAELTALHAAASVGTTNVTSNFIATRGQRLVLAETRLGTQDLRPKAFHAEMLGVVEIDADQRVKAVVVFDTDDLDSALAELDARYLAGEAAAHTQTWSVIAEQCAAFNRQEIPAADWITVDHRRLAVIDATQGQAAMHGIWDLTPDLIMRITAVHRLGGAGAVATYAACGTSPEGLAVEWRMILFLIVEGDRIVRCEIFDESDLDAALARFDEL